MFREESRSCLSCVLEKKEGPPNKSAKMKCNRVVNVGNIGFIWDLCSIFTNPLAVNWRQVEFIRIEKQCRNISYTPILLSV